MNRNWKKIALGAGASLVTLTAANAADYADIAAATTALTGVPAVVLPVALAFITLAVGLLTIRMLGRGAKKGMSVA